MPSGSRSAPIRIPNRIPIGPDDSLRLANPPLSIRQLRSANTGDGTDGSCEIRPPVRIPTPPFPERDPSAQLAPQHALMPPALAPGMAAPAHYAPIQNAAAQLAPHHAIHHAAVSQASVPHPATPHNPSSGVVRWSSALPGPPPIPGGGPPAPHAPHASHASHTPTSARQDAVNASGGVGLRR